MNNIELDIAIFLEDWAKYSKNLHTFCDAYELEKTHHPEKHLELFDLVEKNYGVSSQQLFSSAYYLRKKLFLLDEHNLNIGTIYQWNYFKKQFPIVEDIQFLTPFSFTLYWNSIPELLHLYKEYGLREASYICHNFIENLVFQYPKTLEMFAEY